MQVETRRSDQQPADAVGLVGQRAAIGRTALCYVW